MVNVETLVLEGEMSEMLSLMKKTFYSNKEIFLRELINNASNDINAQHLSRGTKITLFLKDDQLEYLEETTIKNLINKHCKLIIHPIYLWSENTKDHWQLIHFWHRQEMENKFLTQKLHNHLHDDLAFSILFKLPLKSLKRFGSLSTGELKVIPRSPTEFVPFHVFHSMRYLGFGYDFIRDDYKVIRCMEPRTREDEDFTEWDYTPLYEIYSLRSNTWRKVKIDITFSMECGLDGNFYFDGMCHWLCETKNDVYLVSFDMSNEAYYTTLTPLDIPLDICDDFDMWCVNRYLFLLNGSIALMSNYECTKIFYISILTELGKKETWNKLFTLGPLPCNARPIGARSMGNILFETHDGELVWFDLSTHKITKVGFKAHGGMFSLVIYKESLLQIEGINN
ncbi:molecular chaperone HtpG [Vigna unguiculata]|uniref:Molecular chaperone HtpG n=1 Tax=Vigna unguiculata TaxID=3917 RepID=A0A4D6LW96_VIGUN|nr:molecular chaperone HtpG [Vigna unguiculata]